MANTGKKTQRKSANFSNEDAFADIAKILTELQRLQEPKGEVFTQKNREKQKLRVRTVVRILILQYSSPAYIFVRKHTRQRVTVA